MDVPVRACSACQKPLRAKEAFSSEGQYFCARCAPEGAAPAWYELELASKGAMAFEVMPEPPDDPMRSLLRDFTSPAFRKVWWAFLAFGTVAFMILRELACSKPWHM